MYACDGHEGLAAIAREAPSVILTDLVMPDMEGLELVQQVRIQHPHISVILVTAFGSEEVAMRALRAGAANYIPKKHLARDLVPTLRQVLAIAGMTPRAPANPAAAWSGASRPSFSKTIPS